MKELRVLAAAGITHGSGFPEASFERGLSKKPHFIAADSGSSDPGPYYLGAGDWLASRAGAKKYVRLLMLGARRLRVSFILGTCATAGAEPHLQWMRGIVEEIAREDGLHFQMALIHAEQDKDYLKRKLAAGRIWPLGPVPELKAEDIDRSKCIVGMMGAEPIAEAVKQGAEVVLCGRSSDSAVFAAIPVAEGYLPGLAWHAAKIVECGAMVALPKRGTDCMLAHLRDDYFLLEPSNADQICTTVRVAAHALYENASPIELHEPGGMVDTSECSYEQVDERTVKVAGSKFVPASKYTIKLEGVEMVGYRTITIAATRDPGLICQLDGYLETARHSVGQAMQGLGIGADDYSLVFNIYGRNAVMGNWEPRQDFVPNEVGILADAVGKTQDIANTALASARFYLLHSGFEGQLCISGNMAFPYSPSDIVVGPTYRFNIWHLVQPDDPLEMFPIEMVKV